MSLKSLIPKGITKDLIFLNPKLGQKWQNRYAEKKGENGKKMQKT